MIDPFSAFMLGFVALIVFVIVRQVRMERRQANLACPQCGHRCGGHSQWSGCKFTVYDYGTDANGFPVERYKTCRCMWHDTQIVAYQGMGNVSNMMPGKWSDWEHTV